jgi:single-stranded DNA-binding protein
MSASSQSMTLCAKIAKDPEMKYSPGGTAFLKYSLPIDVRTSKDGQYTNETLWIRVTEFGKMAERHNEIYHKGTIVSVTGKLGMPRVSDSSAVYLDLEVSLSEPISNFGKKETAKATQDEIPF